MLSHGLRGITNVVRRVPNPASYINRVGVAEIVRTYPTFFDEVKTIMDENMKENNTSAAMRGVNPRSNRSTIVLDVGMHGGAIYQAAVEYMTKKHGSDSHFSKSRLPMDISENVVILSDAAPNTCTIGHFNVKK